jgi:hypothetical protein
MTIRAGRSAGCVWIASICRETPSPADQTANPGNRDLQM